MEAEQKAQSRGPPVSVPSADRFLVTVVFVRINRRSTQMPLIVIRHSQSTALLFISCITLLKKKKKQPFAATLDAVMAKLPVLIILVFSLVASGGMLEAANAQKTWCVPKPSSDQAALLENINYACSQVDCTILKKGGPCFYPDTPMNHASIAMNLYYQAKGRNCWNCDFKNSGLIVYSDPSYGNCIYE